MIQTQRKLRLDQPDKDGAARLAGREHAHEAQPRMTWANPVPPQVHDDLEDLWDNVPV